MDVTKHHGGPHSKAGYPDIIGPYHGTFIYLEVKLPGNHPTPIQRRRMAELDAAGAIGGVATTVAEALAVLDRADAIRPQILP